MDLLFVDIETTGLSPFKHVVHGIGAALNDSKAQYYFASNLPEWLISKLADKSVAKIGSNVRQFDLNFLARSLNLQIDGPAYDTSLMSLVADDTHREHGLKELASRLFSSDALKNKNELDLVCKQANAKHVGELAALDLKSPTRLYAQLIARYCCEDVENSRRVFYAIRSQLRSADSEDKKAGRALTRRDYFLNEIRPIEDLLLKLELDGVRVNLQLLGEIERIAKDELNTLTQQFVSLYKDDIEFINRKLLEKEVAKKKSDKGKNAVLQNPEKYKAVFKVSSARHIGELFYDRLGCPPELISRTKTGQYNTKEEQLKFIASADDVNPQLSAAITAYFEIKKLYKLIDTYLGDEDKGLRSLLQTRPTGETYLYPSYRQRTATGRLSVFPIQQLPNKHKNQKAAVVKRFFIPASEDKCFIYSDLSAIELCNAAHLSQDQRMLQMMRDGIDPHTTLASQIFNIPVDKIDKKGIERVVAKTVNYLTIYGGSEGRLMQELALKNRLKFSKDECKKFISVYFETFPGYAQYLENLKQFIEQNRCAVAENGRVRHFPEVVFGQFLDNYKRRFYGPRELFEQLVTEEDKHKATPLEVYYRARAKYRHAINAGYNFPNQSLGGTMMKRALLNLTKQGFRIRATIHDAVIVEVDRKDAIDAAKEVKRVMENCYPLSVPIRSDTKILNSFDEDDKFDVK